MVRRSAARSGMARCFAASPAISAPVRRELERVKEQIANVE